VNGTKRILGSSAVALLAAGGGWMLADYTKPELASGILQILGLIVSVSTTVYFQALRRIEEAREKVLLDQPHKSWFRRKLDARKTILLRRWAVAFSLSLLSAGIGVALKSYPMLLLLLAGYALLSLAILCVMLMAIEFHMTTGLFNRLQDDAEQRKQKRELTAKINVA
jgi:hypothetical protein